jgi:hypothetical protein
MICTTPGICRPAAFVGSSLALLLAAALARPAAAEPASLAVVPADAVWMMHLDMDAARESTVVRRMHDRAMKMHPQLEAMITMAKAMTGMDPRKDVHDVTVYGLDTDTRRPIANCSRRWSRRPATTARWSTVAERCIPGRTAAARATRGTPSSGPSRPTTAWCSPARPTP